MKEKMMKNLVVKFIASYFFQSQPLLLNNLQMQGFIFINHTISPRYMKTTAADTFGIRIQLHILRLGRRPYLFINNQLHKPIN